MISFLLVSIFVSYALPNPKHAQLAYVSAHTLLMCGSLAGGLIKTLSFSSLLAGGGGLELIPTGLLAQLGVLTLGVVLLFFSLQTNLGEKLELSLFYSAAMLGGSTVILTQNLPLALIILELQSYAIYVVLTLHSDNTPASQGCLSYFLVSSLATACITLGWGFLTFTSGTFYSSSLEGGFLAQCLMSIGFILKLGTFPFQG
jgi:NADH:ubiquinone oxidoreductase subunit 2 (subunit N)